jgi:hypothetical protein
MPTRRSLASLSDLCKGRGGNERYHLMFGRFDRPISVLGVEPSSCRHSRISSSNVIQLGEEGTFPEASLRASSIWCPCSRMYREIVGWSCSQHLFRFSVDQPLRQLCFKMSQIRRAPRRRLCCSSLSRIARSRSVSIPTRRSPTGSKRSQICVCCSVNDCRSHCRRFTCAADTAYWRTWLILIARAAAGRPRPRHLPSKKRVLWGGDPRPNCLASRPGQSYAVLGGGF